LRERTAVRLRIIVGVTVLSAAIGAAYGARFAPPAINVTYSAVTGASSGFALCTLEIFLQNAAAATLRRLPVVVGLALRTVAYGAVFVAAAAIAAALSGLVMPEGSARGMLLRPSPSFSIAVALAFNFVFTLRGLFGGRTLLALVTGRYHRPRVEARIVLFLDLHESTPIVERLGDIDFHRFLNRVFYDINDPVIEAGGEIYRYVGDEIIVTWPLARGARDGACLVCLFAIADALALRRGDYRSAFGAEPRLRGALHAGPLVVGEMGDMKREIVMLGDTMNTASRIEDACRATGSDAIASEAVLRAIGTLPPGIAATRLEAMPLRGKTGAVALFALRRA